MNYVTGKVIKELREKKGFTQKELAEKLKVSDKTISKWENERGLPDTGIIQELAESLQVSVAELFAGEYVVNQNRAANMRKVSFYVCPVCGNVIFSVGEGAFSCCGVKLPALEAENDLEEHDLKVEIIENDYFVSMEHEMTKKHYISFAAYVTSDSVQMVKLYPEQNIQVRFARRGHGSIYVYCNRHSLVKYNA
ncbi:MAG: helix-turn-helix domain-containing protein [Lachnospira sp.]|nr:helix-turn-helix domain-containing protein [Lachnospira sp.]